MRMCMVRSHNNYEYILALEFITGSVSGAAVGICLFILMSWFVVGFGIYLKRRKRLRTKRLATTVLRYSYKHV